MDTATVEGVSVLRSKSYFVPLPVTSGGLIIELGNMNDFISLLVLQQQFKTHQLVFFVLYCLFFFVLIGFIGYTCDDVCIRYV